MKLGISDFIALEISSYPSKATHIFAFFHCTHAHEILIFLFHSSDLPLTTSYPPTYYPNGTLNPSRLLACAETHDKDLGWAVRWIHGTDQQYLRYHHCYACFILRFSPLRCNPKYVLLYTRSSPLICVYRGTFWRNKQGNDKLVGKWIRISGLFLWCFQVPFLQFGHRIGSLDWEKIKLVRNEVARWRLK